VGTNLGVAFSNDSGKTWAMVGPISDLITDLIPDPGNSTKLFAGTLNGLYYSTDGGSTWIGTFLEGEVITSISIAPSNPNRVYVSCLFGKIYRSDDTGKSWELIRASDPAGSAPLAVDPDNANIVYIGPAKLGLFRSIDAGKNWEYVGLKGTSISSISINNYPQKIIFVGTDDRKGVFVSKDNGKNWSNSGSLVDQVVSMAIDNSSQGTLLITTKTNGILATSDFGNNWSTIGLGSFNVVTDFAPNAISIQGDYPDSLIASSLYIKGLFISNDQGASWIPLMGNSELLRYGSIVQLLLDPNNASHLIISVNGGNVLESYNKGNSWENITLNLPLGGYAPLVVCWINNARNSLRGLAARGRVGHLPKMGAEPCVVVSQRDFS
jgi:photosystem II stability/assembly factor-like uncharacterized protein